MDHINELDRYGDDGNESAMEEEETMSAYSSRSGKESELSGEVESQHTYPAMIRLEDQMNNESLEMLQKIFQEADEDGGGGLDLDEFRQAMIKTMAGRGEIPDDNQLSIIFMKVDANCDGTVDWEEFCSYMLMENQLKDVMTSVDREMEFPCPAREIPSFHRDTIARITYYPKMTHGGDDPADSMGGRYLTVSKDGILHFWSMDLHNLRSHTLLSGLEGKTSSTQRTMWVTDCVVLPNAKKVAVSSADREIVFYDCSANSFEKQFILCGLEYCVVTMDYWFNPHKLNESVLLFGDAGGSVSCIKFSAAVSNLFDLSLGQAIPSVNCRRVSLAEILLGRHANVEAMQFTELHQDWVRKVRYYPTLQCFISCASSTNNSMYLGDLDRKKTRSMFRTRKGINSFDYCKEWNVIVTGGLDHHVRLWNPYVTTKPTSILKGHSACITHILINSDKGEIISAAQDKVIKIWDMRDLCCVQTIPSRSLLPGPHPISSVYYSTKLHCILVGTNQFSLLEGKNEEPSEEHEIVSHTKPLCGALYNDLFDQVVSCCHDSVVCVWSLENGEKIIQFANAHGDSEITAMTFDQSKRRLITGARDGSVKLWNFNNGCCLRELEPVDDEEITGLVSFKQSIVVVGWSKKIIVYKDCREEEEDVPRIWPAHHKDDILSITFHSPNLVATSCYNGDIKVWNLDTGHTLCVLNANNFDIPVMPKPVIPLELKRRVSENNAVLSAVLADVSAYRHQLSSDPRRHSSIKSPVHKNSILKDPCLLALSKRAKSICPVVDKIEVKDSDYDSVVDKVLFLQKREHHRDTATLLTGESSGLVRAWSIFGGGLLGQFVAGHTECESITALATDEDNTMLITGDTMGYVKVWDLTEYCIHKQDHTRPRNRLKETRVSFLPSLVEDSAKSTQQESGPPNKPHPQQQQQKRQLNLEPPPLSFKFRAHLVCVTCLDFIQKRQLIVTSSIDCSVRLWTYEGKYIGTFGQRGLWNLGRAIKGPKKIPLDIQPVASPDTMASLGTSGTQKWRVARHILRITSLGLRLANKAKKADSDADGVTINIEESLKNVLGKHYQPRKRHRSLPRLLRPQFNQNQVVVYSSLPYKDMDALVEPRIPSTLVHHGHKSSSAHLGDTNKTVRKSQAPTSGTPFKPGVSRRPASRDSARKQVKVSKSPECLS